MVYTTATAMNEESVLLDYMPTTIYPSEYEKTVASGGYIKSPYMHSKGDAQPNLVYGNRKYKTSWLYILKTSAQNKNADIEADAELVIQHTPITNGFQSVYLVIPLKTRPAVYEITAVDKLIAAASSPLKPSSSDTGIINTHNASTFEKDVDGSPIDFYLGEILGYNTKAHVDSTNTVFRLSPMLVKTDFTEFTVTPAEALNWNGKKDFREISIQYPQYVERAQNRDTGVEGFEIYDCEPIIENTNLPKQTIEVMPVTSDLAKKMGTMNALTATIHFFIFLFMTVVAGVTTPILYKSIFVDYVDLLQPGSNEIAAATLKMMNYVGSFILLVFSAGISMGGMSVGDKIQTSIGALMSIFILISIVIVIYYSRLEPMTYSFGAPDADVLKSVLSDRIFGRILLNENYTKIGGVWGTIVTIALLFYFFYTFDKNKKKDKSKKSFMLWYAILFGLVFATYIVTRVETVVP